jgi:hypothetical protein
MLSPETEADPIVNPNLTTKLFNMGAMRARGLVVTSTVWAGAVLGGTRGGVTREESAFFG